MKAELFCNHHSGRRRNVRGHSIEKYSQTRCGWRCTIGTSAWKWTAKPTTAEPTTAEPTTAEPTMAEPARRGPVGLVQKLDLTLDIPRIALSFPEPSAGYIGNRAAIDNSSPRVHDTVHVSQKDHLSRANQRRQLNNRATTRHIIHTIRHTRRDLIFGTTH